MHTHRLSSQFIDILFSMSFSLHKLLLVAAAATTFVHFAGAHYDGQYQFPVDGEHDLIEKVIAANRARDYKQRVDPLPIIAFMKTLTQAEGDAVMTLDASLGRESFITDGVDSLPFKVLLAVALPDGYARFGLPRHARFADVSSYAARLIPLHYCADRVEDCVALRSLLGRSDFAMAAFVLVHFGPQSEYWPRENVFGFLRNFFQSTKRAESFKIDQVKELLKYDNIPHMVSLVEELREFHNLFDRKSPTQTTLLLGHMWNHLRNEAILGVDARARRDREAYAAAEMRAEVVHPHPARIGWAAWGRGVVDHAAGIAGHAFRAVGRVVLPIDERVHGKQ